MVLTRSMQKALDLCAVSTSNIISPKDSIEASTSVPIHKRFPPKCIGVSKVVLESSTVSPMRRILTIKMSWISFFFRIFLRMFFYIPNIFGIIGGIYALYHIYMEIFEIEELEVVVRRRSPFWG